MSEKNEYILGVNQTELDRLEFQHGVWKNVTDKFLDNCNIKKGMKCLDVGSGPGFVSMDLRQRVDDKGEITALEPSEYYLNYFKDYSEKMNWTNIKFINSDLENSDIENEYYDFIFLRWVIDFVAEPEKFLLKLLNSLKKGGVIAIQDYVYEGIMLFPNGGAFDNIAEIVKKYWRAGGGDPYFPVKIPEIFKNKNIELREFTPVTRAGGVDSDVFKWADRFMNVHIQLIADKKVISQVECDELLKDWYNHKKNPETIFFTPVIVNVSGIKL